MILLGHIGIDLQKLQCHILLDYKVNKVMLFEKRMVGRIVLQLSEAI